MSAQELTRSVWDVDADDFPSSEPVEEQARFLLRYAVLAPSSHNSQPWRFRVSGDEVDVAADETRWLDATDPDRRELFLGVGCAVENLCVAADRFGFDARVEYRDPDGSESVATVTLGDGDDSSNHRPSRLFDALTERYTSHDLFDGRPLGTAVRERLTAAVSEDAVEMHLVDDPGAKDAVGELQAEADRLQMEDPEYRRELGHWIGLGALGSSWLAARVGQVVVSHFDLGDRKAEKNSKLIASAPVVAVLTTDSDDPIAQVEAGRAFERTALVATTAGVAVHPMSQTLERPEMRDRLAELLGGDAGVPQHLFRLGYTDGRAEHTPRWPLEAFLSEPERD
jgi:nitroreductase